jgi:hypothetical protein
LHKDARVREEIQQLLETTARRLAFFSGQQIIRKVWRLVEKIIFRTNAAAWQYLDAHQLLLQSAESKHQSGGGDVPVNQA